MTKFLLCARRGPTAEELGSLARLNFFFLFFLFLRFASKEVIRQCSAVRRGILTVMSLKRAATEASLIDVLDRVLDKGIVIDAWVRVSLVGVDLLQVEARIVIASISTYLTHVRSLESNTMAPRLSRERLSLRIDRRRNRVTLPIQPRAA